MNEVRVTFQPDVRIVNDRSSAIRVGLGQQGPRGADGAPGSGGDSVTEARTAAGNLSGHRVVKVIPDGRVAYANASEDGDASTVLGVTTNAAADGAEINVRVLGEVVEFGWSWTAGLPVWLGDGGHLTQTPPAPPAAFSLVVGFAVAPDTIFVRPEPPILL
jgi:hypothetical protein